MTKRQDTSTVLFLCSGTFAASLRGLYNCNCVSHGICRSHSIFNKSIRLDDQPPVRPTKVPYLHLDQGQGGLHTFPYDAKDITNQVSELHWIGTHGCFTCVCLYIPIGEGQCFTAHIDAHNDYRDIREWITETDQEAESLKAYVKERLTAALPFLANGEYANNQLRSEAIILCPRREIYSLGGVKKHSTGWAVVEAVREFFRLEPGSHPTEFAQGFIVNALTHRKQMLRWKDEGMNEETMDRYDQLRRMIEEGKLSEKDEEYVDYVKRREQDSPGDHKYSKCLSDGHPEEWTLQYLQQTHSWVRYS
ncbi:hypothetical protein TI39_contig53g00003 [Zymoseptoria brevis]|uniref:Uncharacterized protein n=1 Tax=Zymoseptoria brevis TaxID=1047168 RepID=A0A0F4GZE7_9PEZI|nr:hypothetical protein TI39_contig53g00003 [Zymoseptoria brevis]